jgi:hypothetical protein
MHIARSIIYFAYLGDEDTEGELAQRRLSFIERQLQWLSDLIGASSDKVELLMAYAAPRAWDTEVHRAAARHGFAIDPLSVSSDRLNRFEYPGFRAMKALAQRSSPDALIYYCHSKGAGQLDERKMGLFRLHTQVALTSELDQFVADPALTRAGLFPSRYGWCWFNLFWIKARYMAGLAVEESADRHQFEELIGDRSDSHAFRHVLPLIDRLPFEQTGITPKPWYRPDETRSPALLATYDRYAGMSSPADSLRPQAT